MKLTSEMLRAATSKAVELGILPRRAHPEDLATNVKLIQEILQAALNAASAPTHSGTAAPAAAAGTLRPMHRH